MDRREPLTFQESLVEELARVQAELAQALVDLDEARNVAWDIYHAPGERDQELAGKEALERWFPVRP